MKHKLKWYTITKLWDSDILCVKGVSYDNAVAKALVLLNISYSDRFNYKARLVNYNITRQCEIL